MSENPFSLLSLEPKYKINLAELEQAYLKAQMTFHPDKFVGQSENEQVKARDKSAAINAAYQSLKDPVARAAVVMKLKSVAVPGERDDTTQDPETLMEAMEMRERLAELKSPRELQDFAAEIESSYSKLQDNFAKYIETSNSEDIQRAYLTLSFYAKLITSTRNQYQKLSVKIR